MLIRKEKECEKGFMHLQPGKWLFAELGKICYIQQTTTCEKS